MGSRSSSATRTAPALSTASSCSSVGISRSWETPPPSTHRSSTSRITRSSSVSSPTQTTPTANGGGIVLKGSTDKSLLWYEASGLWTFNTGGRHPGRQFPARGCDQRQVRRSHAVRWDYRCANPAERSLRGSTPPLPASLSTSRPPTPFTSPSAPPSSAPTPPSCRPEWSRYNTDLHRYEGFTQASAWASLGGVVDQAQTTYISVESDDNTTDVHRIRFFVQGVEVSDFDPTGKLGLGTTTPVVRLDIQDTDAIHIPVGSTVQRPQLHHRPDRHGSLQHRPAPLRGLHAGRRLGLPRRRHRPGPDHLHHRRV